MSLNYKYCIDVTLLDYVVAETARNDNRNADVGGEKTVCYPSSRSMQAVEATIEAAEVALEELQRLFSALAAEEQEQRLPPGIAARAARLAEIAGGLGETAGLLQGPAVASAHSGDDESSEASESPPPTGSDKGFASRIKTGVRTQGTRLTQRRHGSFSRASGRRPWEGDERGGVERCGCGRRPVPLSVHC